MSRKVKAILILIVTVIVAIAVENRVIDAYVAKSFPSDMYGFKELIVSLFVCIKLIVNGATAYIGYVVFKFINFFD